MLIVWRAGIDDINIHAGPWGLSFPLLARARDLAPRVLAASGFASRAVIPPFEDLVTLAVNAARPVVARAGPDAFALLIVATESSCDCAKPISTYVHRHLGLPDDCRNFEIKHACYGGAAALRMATCWVASPDSGGKKALVVTVDAARRHFGHPAELASGAGAVAVSVSERPSLLGLEPESGAASCEVYDVARPTPTAEVGDPGLSLHAYLDLLEIAWDGYRRRVGGDVMPHEHFQRFAYHAPLISLVERAHGLLLADLGEEQLMDHFARCVEPGLACNRELGNVYSGAVLVSLAGHLLAPADVGSRIALYAYGSGACAEFGALRVLGGDATPLRDAWKRSLAERRLLSVREYEQAVLALEQSLSASDYEPAEAPPGEYADRGLLVLRRVKDYRREYVQP